MKRLFWKIGVDVFAFDDELYEISYRHDWQSLEILIESLNVSVMACFTKKRKLLQMPIIPNDLHMFATNHLAQIVYHRQYDVQCAKCRKFELFQRFIEHRTILSALISQLNPRVC